MRATNFGLAGEVNDGARRNAQQIELQNCKALHNKSAMEWLTPQTHSSNMGKHKTFVCLFVSTTQKQLNKSFACLGCNCIYRRYMNGANPKTGSATRKFRRFSFASRTRTSDRTKREILCTDTEIEQATLDRN